MDCWKYCVKREVTPSKGWVYLPDSLILEALFGDGLDMSFRGGIAQETSSVRVWVLSLDSHTLLFCMLPSTMLAINKHKKRKKTAFISDFTLLILLLLKHFLLHVFCKLQCRYRASKYLGDTLYTLHLQKVHVAVWDWFFFSQGSEGFWAGEAPKVSWDPHKLCRNSKN